VEWNGGIWTAQATVELLPTLTVMRSGKNFIISLPYPSSGWSLQQTTNIGSATGWSAWGGMISTNGSANSITTTALPGNLFFRLVK
jgi:hypothetical protein